MWYRTVTIHRSFLSVGSQLRTVSQTATTTTVEDKTTIRIDKPITRAPFSELYLPVRSVWRSMHATGSAAALPNSLYSRRRVIELQFSRPTEQTTEQHIPRNKLGRTLMFRFPEWKLEEMTKLLGWIFWHSCAEKSAEQVSFCTKLIHLATVEAVVCRPYQAQRTPIVEHPRMVSFSEAKQTTKRNAISDDCLDIPEHSVASLICWH